MMTSDIQPLFVFMEEAMANSSELIFGNVSSSSTWSENSSFTTDAVEEDYYEPYHERPETYIVPIVFALIFIVGVLGNGTLVLIFVRHRNMRNVPNTYILSLALGDLLVIVTCVPFTSVLYTLESWPFGELICKLSECVKDISTGVSVFTLTALSAERYCAIVNPIRRHVMLATKPLTLLTALGIWVLALIFALPSAIFSYIQIIPLDNNRTIEICSPFPEEFGASYAKFTVMFKFLVYYAIPLCIIAGFYVLMAIHLELSTRNMPGEMQGQSTQIVARKKVAKMVLLFVVIFIVCFLPYHTFMLWFRFNPNAMTNYDEYWNAFRIVGFCFSFINSCVNPIALYCVSGAFRKHFNNYLFCCCVEPQLAKRRGTMPSTATMYETSSHTMVHFNSTYRRHPHQLQLDNFNSSATNTTVFNHDKT